jgi:hypothetical protein
VLAEKRTTDYAQRQIHHRAAQLDYGRRLGQQAIDLFIHQTGITSNALVTKAGLDAPTLRAPSFTVARQEPIAEYLEIGGAFAKGSRFRNQDLVYDPRITGGIRIHPAQLGVVKVAIRGETFRQRPEYVLLQVAQVQ